MIFLFFTTIPIAIGTTGLGTGLVLSLSYHFVKAHGGELKVVTLPADAAAQPGKEARPDDTRPDDSIGQASGRDAGTEFIIQLPL